MSFVFKHATTLRIGDIPQVFYGTKYGDPASITTQRSQIRTAFSAVLNLPPEQLPALAPQCGQRRAGPA